MISRATPSLAVALLLSCALVMASSRAQAADEGGPDAWLQDAERLFQQAGEMADEDSHGAGELYRRAAEGFERLADDAPAHNGPLFYNTANAHFLAGDLGRAILNYRRAQEHMPGDAALEHNLAYARSQRLDTFTGANSERALKTLLFWHYDLTARARCALFAIAYVLLWAFAAWRRGARASEAKWSAVVCLVLSIAMAGSLASEKIHDARVTEGVVLDAEVVARQGDGAQYDPAFTAPLHAGSEFVLIEDRDRWLRVAFAGAPPCWIPARSVAIVD